MIDPFFRLNAGFQKFRGGAVAGCQCSCGSSTEVSQGGYIRGLGNVSKGRARVFEPCQLDCGAGSLLLGWLKQGRFHEVAPFGMKHRWVSEDGHEVNIEDGVRTA